MEVFNTMKGRVMGPDPQDIPKLVEKNPVLVGGTIPAETYKDHPAIPSVRTGPFCLRTANCPKTSCMKRLKNIREEKHAGPDP